MKFLITACFLLCFALTFADEVCNHDKADFCLIGISTGVRDPEDLFQTKEQLEVNCPVMLTNLGCIRDYLNNCQQNNILGNQTFEEAFGNFNYFVEELCTEDTFLRNHYLQTSGCLLEHAQNLNNCSRRQISYQALFTSIELENEENRKTYFCMDRFLQRSCYLTVASRNCGIEAATIVRFGIVALMDYDDISDCFK